MLDNIQHLTFIDFLLVFLRDKLFALELCNLLFTSWATYWFTNRHLLYDLLSEAIDMDLMETVSSLQHVQVLIELVVLTDKLITEHAETLLPHLLHLLINRMCSLFFMGI